MKVEIDTDLAAAVVTNVLNLINDFAAARYGQTEDGEIHLHFMRAVLINIVGNFIFQRSIKTPKLVEENFKEMMADIMKYYEAGKSTIKETH